MSEWLCSFHQTKRKRPNIHQQHAIKSKESDDDWSKYELTNRPHKFSNATTRIIAAPKISSSFSRSTAGNNILANQRSSGELPKALVEAYRNRARCKPNCTTNLTLIELPQSVSESLNEKQRCVVESVMQGRSVFFTGPAGCGKTHIINLILQLNDQVNVKFCYFFSFHGSLLFLPIQACLMWLLHPNTQAVIAPKRHFIVTATTGIAACAIGGVTIHSFAGIGTGVGRESEIVGRVMGNSQAVQRWRQCDCLIIDEISMMSAECLDLLNVIASRTRNSREVFGGMQVVVCGDFFQLPPIGDSNNTKFAFEAMCWPKAFVTDSIVLKQVFRQSNDKQFMTILNEARLGELSPESTKVLRVHSMMSARNEYSGNYTQLQCLNHQVDQSNSIEMSKLSGEEHVFNAKDFIGNKAYCSQLKQCSSQERLVLKVGAAVILLKNIDPERGLVNGSRGLVVDFRKATKNSADLPREFRSLLLPVVQFESACKKTACLVEEDEANDLCIIVEPVEWASKVGDTIVCSRTQIPLRLAWALSVSQIFFLRVCVETAIMNQQTKFYFLHLLAHIS